MSFAEELKALALTAPKEKDTEDIFNAESAAKVTSASTDYETLPARPAATLLNERKYEGRAVSRKEMLMLEDDEFPDEQFELDRDLYDIRDEGQESDSDNVEDADEKDTDEVEESASDEEMDNDEVDGSDSDSVYGDERTQKLMEGLQGGGNSEASGDIEDESDQEEDDENDDEDDDESEVDNEADYDISQFANGVRKLSSRGGGSKFGSMDDKFKHLEESAVKKFPTSDNVSEDVRKGRCIGHQLKIWDKLLEYRIQFQWVLTLSNQLPPSNLFGTVMKEFVADPDNRRLYRQSLKNVEKAFEQLITIRQQLVNMHPEVKKSVEKRNVDGADSDNNDEEILSDDEKIPSDIASGYSESDEEQRSQGGKCRIKKRSRDEEVNGRESEAMGATSNKKTRIHSMATQTIGEFHKSFLPFRNATIEKWYQRTKLGAGTKGTKAGYTALEQPPLKQIEHIMADQDRLVERTRIKRSQYNIVGMPDLSQQIPGACPEASGKQVLPEIFDDDDFYHHLLREVIERKTQDVSDPFEISRHWIEIQKLRSKIKRRVDTKASKGRRIRYDVVPKLVSFMTPHDAATFSEQASNDLFSSIFGKQPTSAGGEIRANVTKNDMAGFKLFS